MAESPQWPKQLRLLGNFGIPTDPNKGLTMKDKMIHPAPIEESTDTTSIAVLKVWSSLGLDGAERALMSAFQYSYKIKETFFGWTEPMR